MTVLIKDNFNPATEIAEGGDADVDVLIFGTGFRTSLPYFSEQYLRAMDYMETSLFQPLLLHRSMLNPGIPQAAFVGMYRGPIFGVIEFQVLISYANYHTFTKCTECCERSKRPPSNV
jgi:dimethylaniline monooxygenase (N-oxide forming)